MLSKEPELDARVESKSCKTKTSQKNQFRHTQLFYTHLLNWTSSCISAQIANNSGIVPNPSNAINA